MITNRGALDQLGERKRSRLVTDSAGFIGYDVRL